MANERLTGKQIRHLRALGHHLKPVVLIGKAGISEAVIRQVNQALYDHELVKIRLQETCPVDRKLAADELSARTSSYLVQVLGRTILLFKQREDEIG